MSTDKKKHRFDIIVIGAGAAGLACVVGIIQKCLFQKKELPRILLIEKNKKPGKKLLMTGNGRCNITHNPIELDAYHGHDVVFAQYTLNTYNHERICNFFSELGLKIIFDSSGRGYPYTLHSGTVLDCLRFAVEDADILIQSSAEVRKISKTSDGYHIQMDTPSEYISDRVVYAVGGACAPQSGSDGQSYALAESLGHKKTKIGPGIVQIKTENSFVRKLTGLRFDAKICLYIDNELVRSERGELLFTDYGISGPIALQISSIISSSLLHRIKCHGLSVKIDFMPDLSKSDVLDLIKERVNKFSNRPVERLMTGLFVNRLAIALIRYANDIPMSQKINQLDSTFLYSLADAVKGVEIEVLGVRGLNDAQVTIGGIQTSDFSSQTMESKINSGFYAIGEVLDIDGDCGGYNLHWAWASALVAADHIVASMEHTDG